MPKRKSKILWIARDNDGWYCIARNKMEFYDGAFINQNEVFCEDIFEKTTGIILERGQQKKFRLTEVK